MRFCHSCEFVLIEGLYLHSSIAPWDTIHRLFDKTIWVCVCVCGRDDDDDDDDDEDDGRVNRFPCSTWSLFACLRVCVSVYVCVCVYM